MGRKLQGPTTSAGRVSALRGEQQLQLSLRRGVAPQRTFLEEPEIKLLVDAREGDRVSASPDAAEGR